ncbi:MAG: hypothetical protein IH612_00965 [Desulfofustis sp.]|nr:hypothetical protein [Desulfofustis sp.]
MTSDPFHLSARELRGKQSVRATFKLPDETIDLLKTAAEHLGVKQKSLLDQLVEDREVLSKVAEEGRQTLKSDATRRQKTFVLSRRALAMLDEMATRHGIARDRLLECSVQRLTPFVQAEKEKQKKRMELFVDIATFLDKGHCLLHKTESLLDKDDRLRQKIEKLVGQVERTIGEMEALIVLNKS